MIRCSSCDAPIFFATSATTGARIPFDAAPVPGGTHILNDEGFAEPADDGYVAGYTYVSHFTTCPNATQHSKKKPGKRQLELL